MSEQISSRAEEDNRSENSESEKWNILTDNERSISRTSYERVLESVKESGRMHGKKIEEALDALDTLKFSDLNSVLIAMSERRAESVQAKGVISGNKFHRPADVDPRALRNVEDVFYDTDPTLQFIDLSPLQPFGINTFLTGTSEKKIVASLRGSEVNADPTTALFRSAYAQFAENGHETRLATNSRSVRTQNFGKNSKLLQHFKTCAEVTVGHQDERFGHHELEVLTDHMAYELECIQKIASKDRVELFVSNLYFTKELQDRGELDVETLKQTMRNYDKKQDYTQGIDLEKIPEQYNLTRGVKVYSLFLEVVRQRHPELLDLIKVDMQRVAGLNYYRHICYKILGTAADGQIYPLADGGTTNWAQKVSDSANKRQIFTVASGVGTELLARHFIED